LRHIQTSYFESRHRRCVPSCQTRKILEKDRLTGLIGAIGKIGLSNCHFGQNSFILPKFTIDVSFLYFYYSTHLAKLSQFTIFSVRLEAEGFLEVRVGKILSFAGGLHVQCGVDDGAQR
jgi:hypothetical protein